MNKRFHLQPSKSPTHYNVSQHLKKNGWTSTRFNYLASFNEKNFLFDPSTAESLEFKHLLSSLMDDYFLHVMPETFRINDHNWPRVLNEVSDKFNQGFHSTVKDIGSLHWILKPSTLNNGKHIKIFDCLSKVEQHYVSFTRLGGEHVLQRYLKNPHLLKGHKYSIRMFVVLTNYGGSYLYPHGYLNVSRYPFQSNDFSDLRPHLTNEYLSEDESNVIQIPTQRLECFAALYTQIKCIVTNVIQALQKKHPHAFICHQDRALSIFGFDFLVDIDFRVWLLEANHGPCFPTTEAHPLHRYLYEEFWQNFINSFVIPVAIKQKPASILYHPFESIL